MVAGSSCAAGPGCSPVVPRFAILGPPSGVVWPRCTTGGDAVKAALPLDETRGEARTAPAVGAPAKRGGRCPPTGPTMGGHRPGEGTHGVTDDGPASDGRGDRAG